MGLAFSLHLVDVNPHTNECLSERVFDLRKDPIRCLLLKYWAMQGVAVSPHPEP